MNILILDDDASRIPVLKGYLRRWLCPGSLLNPSSEPLTFAWASNLSGFVRAISLPTTWDVMLLDRDLDLMQEPERVGQQIASGEHAARMVASLSMERRPGLVVVHSLNAEGSRRMMRELIGSGVHALRKPFRDDGLERWLDQ